MKRILSAVVLIPAALLVVIYAPPAIYLIGVAVLGSLCLYEYCGLIRNMGIRIRARFVVPVFWLLMGVFGGKTVFGWSALQESGAVIAAVAAALIAVFLAAIWRGRLPMRERALALMAETLGVFYFVLFLYPVFSVRFEFGSAPGLQWTILLLAVIWANDIAALAVGKKLGKTRFAPKLSPKKTNEGALAGLIAGAIAAVLLQRFLFSDIHVVHVIAVSVLAGVFGQLGDLAESLLKRAAEVKDSSRLIPGHGGALDRMDSLLFAFPVLYIYLVFLYQ
ncbi:MAG: phosphatidate cytidylyltransferase [Acidobacteriota bacterium]|jgi:phosphatidate cytidylyltransferase|nr:phosphatidate cytidylyltransferase [Acidobacteriota bacterium]